MSVLRTDEAVASLIAKAYEMTKELGLELPTSVSSEGQSKSLKDFVILMMKSKTAAILMNAPGKVYFEVRS